MHEHMSALLMNEKMEEKSLPFKISSPRPHHDGCLLACWLSTRCAIEGHFEAFHIVISQTTVLSAVAVQILTIAVVTL